MKSIFEKETRFMLTKNDIEIFKVINKFGFIRKRNLYNIFGDKNVKYENSYFKKRVMILSKAGYLKSIGYHFGLTTKSKKELILYGIKVHYGENKQRVTDKEAMEISKKNDVLFKLSFKKILSKVEFIDFEKDTGNSVSNLRLYAGVVWNDLSQKYLVYKGNKLDGNFLGRISLDLSSTSANNVIYITKNIQDYFKYRDEISSLNCNDFKIILDLESGFETLNLYFKGFLNDEYIAKYLNFSLKKEEAKVTENGISFFDGSVVNLFLLDAKKEASEINKLKLKKEKKVYYVFEENYEKYFDNLVETYSDTFNQGKVKITLEKYISFLKEELEINI